MTRTFARRLAAAGGALGIVALTCVGTAAANSARHTGDVSAAAAHDYAPHVVILDKWDRMSHHGLVGGLSVELDKILRVLV